ncbi:metal ABC transporter ATP-binding protein [Sulfurimonas sp.]|uniref:metal ABC transporter ATP-binding protein n=1 Tax=Sulfurimonas sp. TaxID=2022749 RepID=UPI002629CE1B|nr:metal ABC transporter ATP-binding protein [Sulfurimonas sp.]
MSFKLPIFDVKNLSFKIRDQIILENITFEIYEGEYIAIIGPNGGGKTTLIRLLLGLETPSSGEIKIFGQKLKNFKEWHKIGYVPQRATLVDENFPATVEDIVKMGRIAKRGLFAGASSEDRAKVHDAMVKMDILDLKNRMVGTLSGGQRQRVMIARALASSPKILILDEPNTGVDMLSQQRFYTLLAKLNKEENITILFITHDIGVIVDDIGRVFTINQKATICNDPKQILSCEEVSELYGINAHSLYNHKHEH